MNISTSSLKIYLDVTTSFNSENRSRVQTKKRFQRSLREK